jgi:hypothetical protein
MTTDCLSTVLNNQLNVPSQLAQMIALSGCIRKAPASYLGWNADNTDRCCL